MTREDKQTVLSVVLAATLSFVVVGVALLTTLAFTDRPRSGGLEDTLSIRPDPKPMAPKPAINVPVPEMY